MLKWLNALPVYYPGDAELYLKYGKIEGGHLLAVFNLAVDVLDSLELVFPQGLPRTVERLTPEGHWEPVPFGSDGVSRVTIAREIATLLPEIFRLN